MAFQGHADLVAPSVSCSGCSCSPVTGSCALPPNITTSSAPCGAAVSYIGPFDGPVGWDGICTDQGALTAGALCNGTPCAVSLIADPLGLSESGCSPSKSMVTAADPPAWTTAVLGCLGTYLASACGDLAKTCAPSAADAPGFVTCILRDGDHDCPPSYPIKHLAYAAFDDTRGCAPCACSLSPGSCKAVLAVFTDGACSDKPAVLTLDLSAAGPSCGDLPHAGVALGSKTIDALAYEPGACAPSGGDAVGGVAGMEASTFCCVS